MASSGYITLSTKSVDYGGGRGHVTLTNVIGWSVDNNGYISFWSSSSSDNAGGYWGICYGSGPYYVHLVPQVSYDGGASWMDLASADHYVNTVCTNPPDIAHYTNTIAMSVALINSLGSYHLSGDCSLRFLYYMDPTPAPSAVNQYAFPNESYSEVTQVPVHIDVSWTATLRYNANGGSGAPGNQTQTVSGNSATFTVSSVVPTRSNHRFDGWSRGGSLYHGGQSISIAKDNPDQTLYAQWTEYYRPGERKINGVAKSHNRAGGVCDRHGYGEMKTLAGGVETSDPPKRKTNGTWYNQRRIGAE